MRVSEHVREIEESLCSRPARRDSYVIDSWHRCLNVHGLDPSKPSPARIVPDTQLKLHQEQAERLTSIARSGVEDLFRRIAGENYVLLLTDPHGITVDFFGDRAFEDDLRQAGLYLGADWSEAQGGTSGVGACIATGQAVTVHQNDHFDLNHVPLSCSAAPIYGLEGELAAVLDVSLLRSPQPKSSQALALHMVRSAARRIELANMMASMRGDWVLRFSTRPEFLDVDPDAAIAIDGGGVIIAYTGGAADMLASPLAGPITGRRLDEFFELVVDDLPLFSRALPTQERRLFLKSGAMVYAHAIAPQTTTRSRSNRVPSTVLPTPLGALCADDPAMQQVIHTACRLATSTVPILITGASGTGKEKLARAIHKVRDETAPFITIPCADFPERELDRILFGTNHANPRANSGANSGANQGLIHQAGGGVLLLDEIVEMPASVQGRLVRALSDDEIRPSGGPRPQPLRAKIVSVSSVDVTRSNLRPDLLFRLAGAVLTLPALADRRDLDWLIDRLVRLGTIADPRAFSITPAARAELHRRRWPGNIRELKNTLAVAIAMAEEGVIDLEHLPRALFETSPPPGDVARHLEDHLISCGWNVARVARHLGVNRSTVHRQMKRAGLRRP